MDRYIEKSTGRICTAKRQLSFSQDVVIGDIVVTLKFENNESKTMSVEDFDIQFKEIPENFSELEKIDFGKVERYFRKIKMEKGFVITCRKA